MRWRRKDLARWLLETFAISLDETTVGRELKALGFAKISARPRHYAQNELIENGDRRGRLSIITPNANILRLRDAIHPDEVTTPVRRVCYIAQLVLSGDS